jgi:beta-glucosidase-like glycosyl hydrolase
MSLREKVGQMICCRYEGGFINRESEDFLKLSTLITEDKIGGLIIFRGMVYEAAVLTNTLQEMSDIPLLIASDLERGLGQQVREAVEFPTMMALGATRDENMAYRMGRITALEARAVGIHMTYAPVVDVNINPQNPIINTRSFGEDPKWVSRLASSFIRGCQESGLIATAKHFPGHGDTDVDSHSVLPTITGNFERLEQIELFPFKRVIQAGVGGIMTAHIRLPALDPTPDLPATLSHPILSGLLRQKMGYKGLIVTDAMEMGAVTRLFESDAAVVRAVQAGADVLLLPLDAREAVDAVTAAVQNGKIRQARIDASVRRILEAKARMNLHRKRTVDVNRLGLKISRPEAAEQAKLMFEKSITLVKNEKNLVPLRDGEKKISIFSLSSDPGGYYAGLRFVSEMEGRQPDLEAFFSEPTTGDKYYEQMMSRAAETDLLVVVLFSRLRDTKGTVDILPRHVEVINKALRSGLPTIVISFGSPYFLKHFPDVDAYLCAYGYSQEAQAAAARVLCGEVSCRGKLPVSLPGLYPCGYGLRFDPPAREEFIPRF